MSRRPAQTSSFITRKAVMPDLPRMLDLINGYASMGIMLPRTVFEMAEGIRDFTVAVADGRLVGCGALHFYGPGTAEIRSLAVHPDWKKLGVGRKLVETLEAEAVQHGVSSVFAFTYVPGFFEKLGFAEVDRAELPSKVWKDCLICPKFQSCDEIAVKKVLSHTRVDTTPICGEECSSPSEEPILMPILR